MAPSPLERPPGQVAALARAGVEAATVCQRCVSGQGGEVTVRAGALAPDWIPAANARRISRVAGDHSPADDGLPYVTIVEIVEDACGSTSLLAQAFGSSVLEPTWWPADTGQIDSFITRSPGQSGYRIGSIRGDGVPVGIIARVDAAEARCSPRDWLTGEWREPGELAEMQGLIGRVGIPPRLQAFVYAEDLTVVLIGYQTDDEIFRAVKSLRPVKPD